MGFDAAAPRTRRALLAGAIGGSVAFVASAVGRPFPVSAGNDGDVVLGQTNYASATTSIRTNLSQSFASPILYAGAFGQGQTAVDAYSLGGTGVVAASRFATAITGQALDKAGAGIMGYSGPQLKLPAPPAQTGVYGSADLDGLSVGVRGRSIAGRGVLGVSTSGAGVDGRSTTGYGVSGSSSESVGVSGHSSSGLGVLALSTSASGMYGVSSAADQPAVVARSQAHHTGLYGYSGGAVGSPPASPAKTGVYGRATQDGSSRGVFGYSTAGRGVQGQATTGTGGYFAATTGTALRAVGRVKLDKCAGTTTIAAGSRTKVVTPGIDLAATSIVLATLQASAGSGVTVERVSVDPAANTFTIRLTANAAATATVAWLVIG